MPERRNEHRRQPIKEPVEVKGLCPPSTTWQEQGRRLVEQARGCLWSDAGTRALAWLRDRGLEDATIQAAGLGYNPEDRREEPENWGFEADHKPIWLPRGIVIPWEIGGELWRVNIRRPQGAPKYIGPAGYTKGLYGADTLIEHPAFPAVLVEGEFDALTLKQAAGDRVVVVATGSTAGARQPRWLALLALSPIVLVAFDADDAGDGAADWWLHRLPHARRWRPFWGDVNELMQEGVSVRDWIESGLEMNGAAEKQQQDADERPVNTAGELERRIIAAATWDELSLVLGEAQRHFEAGDLDAESVERLATLAAGEARTLPENADNLRLSDLFDEQPVRQVYSRVLGETVVFAADGVEVPAHLEGVVYRESELRQLPGRSPTPMRAIHAAKKVFDGELIDATAARTYEPATPRP